MSPSNRRRRSPSAPATVRTTTSANSHGIRRVRQAKNFSSNRVIHNGGCPAFRGMGTSNGSTASANAAENNTPTAPKMPIC